MIVSGKDFIPVVEDALSRRQQVRMTVRGDSMVPFIHGGETVELRSCGTCPGIGEIVLARYRDGGYVVHRVVRIDRGGIVLRGDARYRSECEGPLDGGRIIGTVVRSWHKGSVRDHSRGSWKALGVLWALTCPAGILLYRTLRRLRDVTAVRKEQ
ncbi:hypothetical protein CHL67_02425 [Prosthecochloris sp. GSB1]|uniref:S24/S26 family peptidase n=1 Tax=Prosthecochloris sp. GSB1 TaxID=281093 RepID=UPI000B8C8840|nr:S24/S26 family peptidase [Prosthecochloris sp. GSB1]ASQ89928.1 hypothetical protein CHL67_02425 [Prosthecochloris sp. GSB1]